MRQRSICFGAEYGQAGLAAHSGDAGAAEVAVCVVVGFTGSECSQRSGCGVEDIAFPLVIEAFTVCGVAGDQGKSQRTESKW